MLDRVRRAGTTAALGVALCGALAGGAAAQSPGLDTLARAELDTAAARYLRAAARLDPAGGYPRYVGQGASESAGAPGRGPEAQGEGAWQLSSLGEWTSGFFPGMLWQLYAYERSQATGAAGHTRGKAARRGVTPLPVLPDSLRTEAERWTAPLPGIFRTQYNHDLGFQFFTSDGVAYGLTGEKRYRATALEAARLLAGRFNPAVGAIKSWDWPQADRPFPVIVDNMMNLELLFWGAKHGGAPGWRALALRHARTTIANHVRPDGGSFHVVVFDPETGRVRRRITHQGYADSTTWARGQAWLVHGFTMAYRETHETDMLRTARRVADYFVAHVPPDGVPCWDFQAPGCPGGPELRDAAAAAIAASGLLELARYVGDADAARYRAAATTTLTTLLSPTYLAGTGSDALLLHATGNRPGKSEIDVAIIYGDYYFVQALRRWLEWRAPGGATAADALR